MKKHWSTEELQEFWKLLPEEKNLLGNKAGVQRFCYLLILKCYSTNYSFPKDVCDIPTKLLAFGLTQYNTDITLDEVTNFLKNYRNYIRYKKEIRTYYGVCKFNEANHDKLNKYIHSLALETVNEEKLEAEIMLLLKRHKIELPTSIVIKNLITKAIANVAKYLFQHIANVINPEHTCYIDNVLLQLNDETGETLLSLLKQDSGKSKRNSIAEEINKQQILQQLQLNSTIIPEDVSFKVLKYYKRKIVSDTPQQIRSRPHHVRYALVIIFCYLKQQEVIDNLADHLINSIHKLKKKADKMEIVLNGEVGKLSRGLDALYQVAQVAHDKPKDIIQDAIYPVVSREQLETLIKIHNLQKNRKNNIRNSVIKSYSIHYRKQAFDIIDVLNLRSNNSSVLDAITLVKKYQNSKREYYPVKEDIITDNLVTKNDLIFVLKSIHNDTPLVCRKDYEYAIFKTLKDRLKTKEVWIEGSFKYKDPATDLPKDFESNREFYYDLLNQPLSTQAFTDALKNKLAMAISRFDSTLLQNPHVRVTQRNGKPWIKLSPLPEQIKPQNLERLKDSINSNWDVISLLDILKEVDLREHFTECFTSSGNREIISRNEIQKRLILCLFAIGTNTGLHRISSASTSDITLEELKYIKRKFINQEDLREAITTVVNGIFRIRNTEIWGEVTSACAADSRKFTSWDQNLMTEWHTRYKGAGIMIYWHVNKQSVCIYSQLKTCSSSEVASMLQGVISHGSEMMIKSQYVDSHGKSELGFALSYLLGFDLLPRYADIGTQKIYLPYEGFNCKNIKEIVAKPINYELIREHYDELIKYATALKIGTATADSIIRQFSRSNFQHPTFKAFIELGKAVKSIFLCKYLTSLELRQEIHSGLNIVENWNSVNDFIFYGNKSEITSNTRDEQEYSMLCLHLLQVSLTYINTLLIQDILSTEPWQSQMTLEDCRGLTPLIYSHVNPYGTFELDMSKRILLKEAA